MLSEKKIDEFITLYENRFGKKLSRTEAYEKAIKLFRLVELIYKPEYGETDYKIQQR